MVLPLLATLAHADDDDLLAEAKRMKTRGVVEVTAGSAAMVGGVAVLIVREGEPGDEVKGDPPQWLLDARSVGGAALLIGGFTTVLVGGRDLGRASALRAQAQVALAPAPNGLVLYGTF